MNRRFPIVHANDADQTGDEFRRFGIEHNVTNPHDERQKSVAAEHPVPLPKRMPEWGTHRRSGETHRRRVRRLVLCRFEPRLAAAAIFRPAR